MKSHTYFHPPPHPGCLQTNCVLVEAESTFWWAQKEDVPEVPFFHLDDDGICRNYKVGKRVFLSVEAKPCRHDKVFFQGTSICLPNGDEMGLCRAA